MGNAIDLLHCADTEEKPKLKHRCSLIRTSLKFSVAPQAEFAGKAARQRPVIHVGSAVA